MFSSSSSTPANESIFSGLWSGIAAIPSGVYILLLVLLGWIALCLYITWLVRKRPPPRAAWKKGPSSRHVSQRPGDPEEKARPRELPARRSPGRPGFRMMVRYADEAGCPPKPAAPSADALPEVSQDTHFSE